MRRSRNSGPRRRNCWTIPLSAARAAQRSLWTLRTRSSTSGKTSSVRLFVPFRISLLYEDIHFGFRHTMPILFRCTLLLSLFSLARSDPFFSSLISKSVQNQYCTRFYHRNGGVGCRTPINGTLGILLPYSAFVCAVITASCLRQITRVSSDPSTLIPLSSLSTARSCRVLASFSVLTLGELIQNLTRRSCTRGVLVVGSDMPVACISPASV